MRIWQAAKEDQASREVKGGAPAPDITASIVAVRRLGSNLESVSYYLRRLEETEEQLVREMLYHALYVPEGQTPFLTSVVDAPELTKYYREWGRAGDVGFVANEKSSLRALGAAWIRFFTANDKGYGYVDNETPELSVAVLPDFRGQGIGTNLLTKLINHARLHTRALSLSVSADNPARSLYERLGFDVFTECGDSLTMMKLL